MMNMQKFIDVVNKENKLKKPKKFKKGEIVSSFLPNRNNIGVILEGSADLVKYDMNGNRLIIEKLTAGSVYGELFHHISAPNELIVEATSTTLIFTFNYTDLTTNKKNSANKDELIKYISRMIIEKIRNINLHIELLAKRSIRDKLLFYFNYISNDRTRKTFKLPFSYTELAQYLNIDRSSMTREITSLCDDGFIKRNSKTITLLY